MSELVFRPAGARKASHFTTHGLRRGLHSYAASRLLSAISVHFFEWVVVAAQTREALARGSGDLVKKSQTNKTEKKPKVGRPGAEKPVNAATGPVKRVDLKAVLEQITNLVGSRAVGMVDRTIDEVNKGHYLAMKYLFEMVGLCPAINSGSEAEEEADSLAKILLERLNILEKSTEVTGEGAAGGAGLESDAVK